jgi:hypothetical protein
MSKVAKSHPYDARYCAPCGILFRDVNEARAHLREVHPEVALAANPLEQLVVPNGDSKG